MHRLVTSMVAVSAVVLSGALTGAHAQTGRDIVGTWTLVSSVAQQGGARVDTYGAQPRGRMLFDGDGRYALIYIGDVPKFASNNRASGTPEENRAAVQGSFAHAGTYKVDEANKTLVFRIETSTFPNFDGTEQRRTFTLSGTR